MTEILEYRPPEGRSSPHALKLVAFRRAVVGSALALLPAALWCLTHQYHGLVGDSELYAVQALARNDPSLARDVFLSGASQDRFTIFSPIYSLFIRILGLQTAAISLLVLCKICFYGAIWAFGRRLYDSRAALLTMALAIMSLAEYGAYNVFHVAEDMLTARTLAEALAMTALSLHVYGRKTAALGLAALALCVHALMALPMVLLLVGLSAGVSVTIMAALVIVTSILIAAIGAVLAPHWTPTFLAIMDPGWLEMVRERSQFVFLQLWRLRDWELNIQPLLSLVLAMVVLKRHADPRVLRVGAYRRRRRDRGGARLRYYRPGRHLVAGPSMALAVGTRSARFAVGDADRVSDVAIWPMRSSVRRFAVRGLVVRGESAVFTGSGPRCVCGPAEDTCLKA